MFIYNKPSLERLLVEKSKNNWNYTQFPTSYIEAENKVYDMFKINQCFPIFGLYVVLSFMLKPIIFHNMFILEVWTVDSMITNAAVLAMEYYLFLLVVPIIFSYDLLYLAVCIHIIFEAKRLNYKLQNVPAHEPGATQKELVHLIKYHQLLIL